MESEIRVDQEAARLASVRRLDLVGTPPEERFDRITRMACALFGVPLSVISLIEAETQFIKSGPGVAGSTYARDEVICNHTISSPDPLVVPDTHLDDRFATLPAVTDAQVRFYAGEPLSLGGDLRLGTLCLFDIRPRVLSDADRTLLGELARWVERELRATLDVDRAVEVQRSLLPLDRAGDDYDLAGVSVPGRGVSGDFYSWRDTAEGVEFTLADVMGKGTGAAILASVIRSAFLMSAAKHAVDALQQASDAVAADLERAEAFATVVHGRYDPATGRLDYADAGHGLTIIVRLDGTVERLGSTGLPLGIAPELSWDAASAVLAPGDVLISATDGVLDLFDGTLDSLGALAGFVTPGSSAQVVAERVRDAALAGPDGSDDMTAVVLRRHR